MLHRDDQCPARLPGLSHTQDGSVICIHCGSMTAVGPGGSPFSVRLVSVMPDCPGCHKPLERRRDALCSDCTFMRRVMFQRQRYERGQMSEFPATQPEVTPRPVTPTGSGSLDDWSADSIALAVAQR